MYEYHLEGFSCPSDFNSWLEDMNHDYPGYVIDSVLVTGYSGYRVMVTFHFDVVLQSEVNNENMRG